MTHDENALEARITTVLEQKPRVHIPAHFAASVLAALPAEQTPRHTATYTRRFAYAAMALLTIALIALPVHEPSAMLSWTSTAFLMEMLFACELMALALWPELWLSR